MSAAQHRLTGTQERKNALLGLVHFIITDELPLSRVHARELMALMEDQETMIATLNELIDGLNGRIEQLKAEARK